MFKHMLLSTVQLSEIAQETRNSCGSTLRSPEFDGGKRPELRERRAADAVPIREPKGRIVFVFFRIYSKYILPYGIFGQDLAEIALGLNRITRQTYAHGIVELPLGAIVEYPETGQNSGFAIAHKFAVDPPSEFHPKLNIQYSFGDNHGGRSGATCGPILSGSNGMPARCNNLKIACKGLKVCSARGLSSKPAFAVDAAAKEVFDNTLAFFCTLLEKGCAFDPETGDVEFAALSDSDSDSDSETSGADLSDIPLRSRKRPRDVTTAGNLCEERSTKNRVHLFLRNLNEFEVPYLRALLTDDAVLIRQYEESAKTLGYGPLSPCPFTAPPYAQKQLCPYWHRSSTGKLSRGILERWKHNCTSTFNIYTPDDLEDCSFVLVICQNPHPHTPPPPAKTPPPLLDIFKSLLLDLDWKPRPAKIWLSLVLFPLP
ncbi:hypothetical protein B0H14DRAFT_2565011 [Mycena olivaceomarginata]|nr:hypothetical protein B0H14DRAFT_2565011 [Mycena olivaceomarginata]